MYIFSLGVRKQPPPPHTLSVSFGLSNAYDYAWALFVSLLYSNLLHSRWRETSKRLLIEGVGAVRHGYGICVVPLHARLCVDIVPSDFLPATNVQCGKKQTNAVFSCLRPAAAIGTLDSAVIEAPV